MTVVPSGFNKSGAVVVSHSNAMIMLPGGTRLSKGYTVDVILTDSQAYETDCFI